MQNGRIPTRFFVAVIFIFEMIVVLIPNCFRLFVHVCSVWSLVIGHWLVALVGNVRPSKRFIFFTVTFLLTAVFNMCVCSYDRLTAIVLPMEKRITMRSAKMTMFLTWMVGLSISIPFAIYRNYKVSFESVLSEDVYTQTNELCCVFRRIHT